MKNKRSKDSFLQRYSGVATAILAAGGANAQSDIILTIVDTTLDQNGQSFEIDLDTNGIIDFRINQIVDSTTFDITGVTIEGRGPATNQVLGLDYANYNYPFKLSVGDTISASKPFKGVGANDRIGYLGLIVDGSSYPNSQFTGGVTDGFLGVRFEGDLDSLVQTYYGWIRVDVAADLRSITIKDFAYANVPDSMIRAGHGSPIEINEVDLPTPEFSQRGQYLDYTFTDETPGKASLTFFDLSGRKVMEVALDGNTGTYHLEGLPKGVLVAVISKNGSEASKKVVVY